MDFSLVFFFLFFYYESVISARRDFRLLSFRYVHTRDERIFPGLARALGKSEKRFRLKVLKTLDRSPLFPQFRRWFTVTLSDGEIHREIKTVTIGVCVFLSGETSEC